MRLELPEGYKHVVDLQADYAITAAHVVEDDRPPLSANPTDEERYSRGRVVQSLCGKEIDTRRPAEGGMAPFGTLPPDDGDRGLTAWPGTCVTCAGRLAMRVGASITEHWDPCGRLVERADVLLERRS